MGQTRCASVHVPLWSSRLQNDVSCFALSVVRTEQPLALFRVNINAQARLHEFRTSFTWTSYGLGICGILHVLAFLFTHWSVKFKAFVCCARVKDLDDAETVLVLPVKFAGTPELVRLERRVLVRFSDPWFAC